jgi:ferrochelatase
MELLYDLDTEAAVIAAERGIDMVRAGTVGAHPAFVGAMVEDAIKHGPPPACPPDGCASPWRP